MPDLPEARRVARRVGSELDVARDAVAGATDKLARLQAERLGATRTADPRDPATSAEHERLDVEIAQAEQALHDAGAALAAKRVELRFAIDAFVDLGDPMQEITKLSADTPLLLLPVRIETRWKDHELWVRVYPDEWAVDGFESMLSDTEVESARRFWASLWRAGGDEDMRRAAWRGIVASHGSGRAGWITGQYVPANPADEPVRGTADLILVVVSDEQFSPREKAVGKTYWEAVWRAEGDADGSRRAALDAAITVARADAVVAHPPSNLNEKPASGVTRAAAELQVAFCDVPVVVAGDTKAVSWTRAARAQVLPDQFVLLGFQGSTLLVQQVGNAVPPTLTVGPDPSAAPADQFHIQDGELVIPDELRWMTDFDEAVKVGLGFRVPLDATTQGGFDRLFVIGLRLGESPEEAEGQLEALLADHHRSRKDFSLLPQGTASNNTEDNTAGYDRLDDPDASYDLWFGTGPTLVDQPDWNAKQDGQWLAECLGIDPAVLSRVAGADGTDQAEARAMNVALWPATWGYFLDTMMDPLLGDDTVERVRGFFVNYVSGRGLIPAVRIGRQPYGILPTTAFSRLRFDRAPVAGLGAPLGPVPDLQLLEALERIVGHVMHDWKPLADAVPHVGDGGDPHQTLLDVVALHPASVDFYQRYAESVEDIFNLFSFDGFGANFVAVWQALGLLLNGRQLLADLGYLRGPDPDILGKLFHGNQNRLKGPVVDDQPLSESMPVRQYTDDHRNYLQWLVDAARSSLDELRREDGFTADKPPTALLYLLLRHSLLLSWWDAGLRFRLDAGIIDAQEFGRAHHEPAFVHISGDGPSESRWNALYSSAEAITGNEYAPLAETMPGLLGEVPAHHLADVIEAISRLVGLPTARLERMLAEHLDCCSHRVDAWQLGLVHDRLLDMRLGADAVAAGAAKRGVYVGAYGWLEAVHREPHVLEPVELSDELAAVFNRSDQPPLVHDRSNGGFVHAPSLNHAATAAVLRSGFMANATPAHPDTMAINISSERMRLATGVLQGLRNGQTLGALLGYRFERGLHDRHALAEIDEFIYPIRKVWPSPGDPDCRQVVDGLDLVRHIEESGIRNYPFGRSELPAASTAAAAAIDLEIDRLLDVHDAVADLALAEGVHQAILGNFDRVAGTLDAYSKGGFPPEPAVIQTPYGGRTLTHRFGVHLRTGLDHTQSPVPGIAVTPRALAEPAVNELLASLLPPPANVMTVVAWVDPDGTPHHRHVTQQELSLQPIDVLQLLRIESEAALGELDERITRFVEVAEGLRIDTVVNLHFTERIAGAVTFFELAPLLEHLRAVLTRSRPLRPTDVLLSNDARSDVDTAAMHADRARAADVHTALQAHRAAAVTLEGGLGALTADPVTHRAELLAQVHAFASQTIDVLSSAGTFALAGSGWGEITERRRNLFGDLVKQIDELALRWDANLAECDAMLARDDALPITATVEERIRVLILAEHAVSASATDPLPSDATAYRTEIDTQRSAFAARLTALRAVRTENSTLSAAYAALAALLPLSAFDATPFEIDSIGDRVVDYCVYLHARVVASIAQCEARLGEGASCLTDHDAAPPGQPRVDALTAAVKALLGADALFVPEFTLAPAQANEWAAAMAWSRGGNLTAHLATHDFPIDDWLHGVARVREKVRSWEQATLLTGALGRTEPQVWPIQLPHAGEGWFALELPAAATATGERLLYSAHYPMAFDKTVSQSGLLVDEWTEVIPGDTASTGIAFHYDRPDSEPPQTWLLAVPPDPAAGWQWDDLVATLHETLDLARMRAVEPDQVADTRYAAFVPATVMGATLRGLSIALNLAVNNNVFEYLRADHA